MTALAVAAATARASLLHGIGSLLLVAVAALVGATVTLISLWVQGRRARHERLRGVVAQAFGLVSRYREFAFEIRRRRDDADDAYRISIELAAVQAQLTAIRGRLLIEQADIGRAFQRLDQLNRSIAGAAIRAAWTAPPSDVSDPAIGPQVTVQLAPLEAIDARFVAYVEIQLTLATRRRKGQRVREWTPG